MEKNNMRHEVWRSFRDGDFQEDDVWDILDGYQSSLMTSNYSTKPSFSTQRLLPSEPRMVPEGNNREGMVHLRQHSAPVNVSDWSMIHRNMAKKVVDDDDDDDDNDGGDDDDDDENVSPEEYFQRRSRSSSSSVMEGVGRKLKGRDLSKVRNAILKKTGFLE